MPSAHITTKSASTSLFGLLSSRISPGPLSASWQAECLMPWCYGTVLTVTAWRCKAELWFQHDRALAYSGDVWQWLNVTYPTSLTGCGELTAWPHWYLELNFRGFCIDDTWCTFTHENQDLRHMWQVDTRVLRHVQGCSVGHFLLWNGQRLLQTPTVTTSSYCLIN